MARERSTSERWLIVAIVLGVVVTIGYSASKRSSADANSEESPQASETDAEKKQRLASEMRSDAAGTSTRIMAASQIQMLFPDSPEGKEASALLPTLRENLRIERIGSQWQYFTNEDPMTSKESKIAAVKSSNTHSFDFPYSGDQNATVALRKHPRYGEGVILSIEKGQLQCRSYSGCSVLVRFGDGEPRAYNANGPEDNSSTSLFIGRYADFVDRMSQVEIVRMQASVYQQGSPMWEFDVSGFKPEMMEQTKAP